MNTSTPDYDVAVIGYGPVGVMAANLLGHYGIRAVVLERDEQIYTRARAVTVNDWTLRIFQSVHLDEILKADMDESNTLHWRTYAGKEVFRLQVPPGNLGHEAGMAIYQPRMEADLRLGVDRFSCIDVRLNQEVTRIEQDATGATIQTTAVADGSTDAVRVSYVLACDGGSSRTREQLGIEMAGETREVTWIVIDAEVRQWWPGCNELVFWSDPVRPVVDIPLSLGNHRWEFPLKADETPADFDTDEARWALLESMGRKREEVHLKHHAFYSHHVRSASTWRSGRVMLLGDAAHLMPPWAGQGMQSGIRDAHNLVWKVREVLAGRLPESILDTYESERAPQVESVTELSKQLGTLIASDSPVFVRARNTIGPVLMRFTSLVSRMMASADPVITSGWVTGDPHRKNALGRMIPQPVVSSSRGLATKLDEVLGSDFVVLGYNVDPREVMSEDQVRVWTSMGARFLVVRPATEPARGPEIVDHTGQLGSFMNRYRCKVVVLRPDRFVAATDRTGLDLPGAASSFEATDLADRAPSGPPECVQCRASAGTGAGSGQTEGLAATPH